MTTPDIDIAVGCDGTALTATFAGVLNSIQSAIFPYQIATPDADLGSLGDVTAITVSSMGSFTVSLPFSSGYGKVLWPQFTFSNVGLTVATQNAQGVTQSFTGTASAVISVAIEAEPSLNSSWQFTVQAVECQITTSINLPGIGGDMALSSAVESLENALYGYLNSQIFSAVSLPPFSLPLGPGVLILPPATPACEAGPSNDNFLVIYSALVPPGQQPPPVQPPGGGTAWPTGTFFIALDTAILNAVATNALPQALGSSWSHDPFSGSYEGQLSVNLYPSPGSGNQISGSISVSGSAGVGCKPGLSASTSFTGSVSFTITLSAQADGQGQDIYLTVNTIGDYNISLGDLPDWFDPVTDALAGAIGSSLTSGLINSQYKVASLGGTTFSVAGANFNVAPQNIAFSTIDGPDDLPMAVATFGISIQAA